MFVKQDVGDVFIPHTQGHKEVHDLVDTGDLEEGEKLLSWKKHKDQALERCYDFLCDNDSYKV